MAVTNGRDLSLAVHLVDLWLINGKIFATNCNWPLHNESAVCIPVPSGCDSCNLIGCRYYPDDL